MLFTSVTIFFTSIMPHIRQEPVKKKGRTVASGKEKEETLTFSSKPKEKKQEASKKENQADKTRFAFYMKSTKESFNLFLINVLSWFSVLWSCRT